jgi:hypothetical protein
VRWQGEPIGKTPLANVHVPCGPGLVVFMREGYETDERHVLAKLGSPVPLFTRLRRPAGSLSVTSEPAGVKVVVSGRHAGNTPITVVVPGFTEVTVVALMPGFKPSSRKVMIDPLSTSVHLTLEPLPGRGAR